jgi:uncharacterized protein YqeY
MIAKEITGEIGQALKAHDAIRLSTLRMLSSALNYEKIALQHELSDEEEITVVKREAKKRKDAIEAYEKAGANDRAEKEKQELEVLREYLPIEMSDEELEKLIADAIKETGASEIRDMGRVIGAVMQKAKGAADGAKVAELVKVKLG